MSEFHQVYFAAVAHAQKPLVKIGFTSTTLQQRLSGVPSRLRNGMPLRILYAVPVSNRAGERWFLNRFKSQLVVRERCREWFNISNFDIERAIMDFLSMTTATNGRKSA